MRDPRTEKLARILTGYSTAVQRGHVVLVSGDQLTHFPEHRLQFMRKGDVYIGIAAPNNVMTLAPAKQQKVLDYQKLLHPILDERVKNTRWVVTRFPSYGASQGAA